MTRRPGMRQQELHVGHVAQHVDDHDRHRADCTGEGIGPGRAGAEPDADGEPDDECEGGLAMMAR